MNQTPPVTDKKYQNYLEQCEQIGKKPLNREGYEVMLNKHEVDN
jgi:hypothetical protein